MVTWPEDLEKKLVQEFGAKRGELLAKKYAQAFSHSYQEDFSVQTAVQDIKYMEEINEQNPLEIDIYEQSETNKNRLYLKLFQYQKPIALSDVLPTLENLDLRTFSERPYRIRINENLSIWISDYTVDYIEPLDLKISRIEEIFREALININLGITENDGFNKLVLSAELPWREITILRTYAKYIHQIGFRFSQNYIEKTLVKYPEIAKEIVQLFKIKFDPKKSSPHKITELDSVIGEKIDQVKSLDEDRILRHLWQLIHATLRTNYFQPDKNGNHKEYLSIKLASELVPDLPLPKPLYEIFVYSPRFEAIHLRSSKVARGGIRWSDRHEDFRTEILGLMKAQKVKNAIIVPSGAKGGFVLKKMPHGDRAAIQNEVIHCYMSFMRGLLDITDNRHDKKIIKPPFVVCYDDDDPYLVVAADKGTATFSDIANSISAEYDFWLGDAFASGGSTGYDHKKTGITARGAWESVKRHFLELPINIENDFFTVIGIGDMSGDVFGNGMIYSDHIKLIAAFDHRHIFIDPTPDPLKSFQERVRLFNLSGSTWDDYNKKIISKGGGVFSRAEKSIQLNAAIKAALGIEEDAMTPTELIRAILKAPVDLLFNGGIGTYVKASTESNADVGDKDNEFCRVNGEDLRCRVVGEGGNLGFTQLGRVEYALQGGLINTDFIDNSAGVDCSDHEVNIKILLNREVNKGKLTEKKRNEFLAKMTNEVSALVLRDNYNQALTMAFSVDHSAKLMGLYHAYLKELEVTGVVNRVIEFLPDDKKILERKAAGIGLTSPELAVLLAYTKIHVKTEILESNAPENPYLSQVLQNGFPAILDKAYANVLHEHPLAREIIATQLSNQIVNEMGITFVYRLQIETGASVGEIVAAYYVASRIFSTEDLDHVIDSLELKISAKMQYELLHYVRHLANLASRWFLSSNRLRGDLGEIIQHYRVRAKKLENLIPHLMTGVTRTYLESLVQRFEEEGISKEIGQRIAVTRAVYTCLNIIETATQHDLELIKTAEIYFEVGGRFNLVWFRDQIASDNREGHWNTLARLTLRDELDILQRDLTVAIMKNSKRNLPAETLIDQWVGKNHRAVTRWEKVLEMLHSATVTDYSMFFIAIRELSNWVTANGVRE